MKIRSQSCRQCFVLLHGLCVLQDYTFRENNTLLDHPDPFNAGKEKLKAGDIPGSVLLFEAAVQKNPEHVEVALQIIVCFSRYVL